MTDPQPEPNPPAPDGFGPEDVHDELAEEDIPGVLAYLEMLGAGTPQPRLEDL